MSKPQQITIKRDPFLHGSLSRVIEATDVKDGFAIHPTVGRMNGTWTITHVKSGLACGDNFRSQAVAQRERSIFRQITVCGVRLADMEACEALSLLPALFDEWAKLKQQRMSDSHRAMAMATRNYVADVLACQVEA